MLYLDHRTLQFIWASHIHRMEEQAFTKQFEEGTTASSAVTPSSRDSHLQYEVLRRSKFPLSCKCQNCHLSLLRTVKQLSCLTPKRLLSLPDEIIFLYIGRSIWDPLIQKSLQSHLKIVFLFWFQVRCEMLKSSLSMSTGNI